MDPTNSVCERCSRSSTETEGRFCEDHLVEFVAERMVADALVEKERLEALEKERTKKCLVFYHADCPDGFGAAYSAWKALKKNAEYLPSLHAGPPTENINGRDIFMLDVSYPRKVMEDVAERARSLTLIDHHKTAMENLRGMSVGKETVLIFDLDQSGAVLAWKFFQDRKPVPRLLLHVQDRDLFQYRLPHTEEIVSAAWTYPRDFEQWDSFDLDVLRTEGAVLTRANNLMIEDAIERASTIDVPGFGTIPVSNCHHEIASAVGNRLSQKAPFAICYAARGTTIQLQFRSADNGADVTTIARKFGGGGHPHASGAMVDGGMSGVMDALKAGFEKKD